METASNIIWREFPEKIHLSDGLLFNDYITLNKKIIRKYHKPFPGIPKEQIIKHNAPFELYPETPTGKACCLIHGLYDSPFCIRDIGEHLQSQGYHVRAPLLPGHGTRPEHLLSATMEEWIATVDYTIESLKKDYDHVILVGNSTGAALSIDYATRHPHDIISLITFSPAILVTHPLAPYSHWFLKMTRLFPSLLWYIKKDELDYTSYTSCATNAARQIYRLTQRIKPHLQKLTHIPLFMCLSQDDETTRPHGGLKWFKHNKHPNSRLIYYGNKLLKHRDSRIKLRASRFLEENILNFSHICIPFSKENIHYGFDGDFRQFEKNYLGIEENDNITYGSLNTKKMNGTHHLRLTYNPDFDFLMYQMQTFLAKLL